MICADLFLLLLVTEKDQDFIMTILKICGLFKSLFVVSAG
jgi:hypothetical protein